MQTGSAEIWTTGHNKAVSAHLISDGVVIWGPPLQSLDLRFLLRTPVDAVCSHLHHPQMGPILPAVKKQALLNLRGGCVTLKDW